MACTGGDTPLVLGGALLAVILIVSHAAANARPSGRPSRRVVCGRARRVRVDLEHAVAKGGFVQWNDWDFYDRPDDPVDVRYIWDANYDGISFPEKQTDVFKVEGGPRSALYWRATTLDDYTGTVWTESRARPCERDERSTRHGAIRTCDGGAAPRNWIRQDVTIEALADKRLVGSAQAVRWEPRAIDHPNDETARCSRRALERGQKYTV